MKDAGEKKNSRKNCWLKLSHWNFHFHELDFHVSNQTSRLGQKRTISYLTQNAEKEKKLFFIKNWYCKDLLALSLIWQNNRTALKAIAKLAPNPTQNSFCSALNARYKLIR